MGDFDDFDDVDPDLDVELEFDRQLRDQLAGPAGMAPSGSDRSEQVLAELRPRLVRARRVRRAQLAATVVAPAVLAIGGLVALVGLASSDTGQATVAGQPEAVATTVDAEERVTVDVTGTTEAPPSPSVDQEPTPDTDRQSDATSPSTTGDAGSTEPTSSAQPSSTPPTTSSQQSTDQPSSTPTTSPAGTSSSVPGSELVESACGSIVVLVVQSSVELIETLPDDGYRVEVKSSSPEVEVSFEGDGHCEFKAEYERGRLVTSVDEEPGN